MRLIRSELMKIRTTNVWWIFALSILAFNVLMLLIWTFGYTGDRLRSAKLPIEQMLPPASEVPPEEYERMRQEILASRDIDKILIDGATQIYTSGQFFILLFIMLLGAILMTNEFFHQTATTTFLTTPQRTKVILAKFAAIGFFSVIIWAVTTAVSIGGGAAYLASQGYGAQLGEWQVQRPILMNLLAFVLWGILGVGLGVLLRSQIAAVVVGAVAYVIGSQAVQIAAFLVYEYLIKKDWVIQAMVGWPSVASQVMISPDAFMGAGIVAAPKWWVGLLVLIGYGLFFGVIGTLITRKRDIT